MFPAKWSALAEYLHDACVALAHGCIERDKPLGQATNVAASATSRERSLSITNVCLLRMLAKHTVARHGAGQKSREAILAE